MAQIPVDQKFHTLNASTPTKDRGSAQTDSLREIYTMQDIIDSVTTGGGIDFTELGDTPSTYVGAAGQAAIVNGTEDGLIFGAAGASELTELTDTPAGYGTSGQVLTTNGTNATTWSTAEVYGMYGDNWEFSVRETNASAVGDYEGTLTYVGTNPAGLTAGEIYYWTTSPNPGFVQADASAASTGSGWLVLSVGPPGKLVSGIVYLSSVPGSIGDALYLSTTAGAITNVAPTGSGEIVRVLGYKIDANRIYFNPSNDWLEIV